MGNDENTHKVSAGAEERARPAAYFDAWPGQFRRSGSALDISYDDFIQTSEARHQAGARSSSRRSTTPATSTKASTRAGTATAARRSRPRRSSSTASARSTRRSRPSGSRRRTTSSGCRRIRDRLLAHYAAHPEFIQPESRRNEIVSLVEGGLEDVAITREGSPGASRSRSTPRRRSTSGSTRC